MEELQKILQRTELFRNLPDDILLQEVLPFGQVQELNPNQFAIEPQQQVDYFSIVITGKIHVMHLFPDGSFSLMTVLTPGEIMGLDLICTRNQISPYHAAAAAPTRLLSFPADLLLKPGRLREDCRQEILGRLLTIISQYNMKKEYRLAILSQKGLRERIITYLMMQSSKRRTNTFRIPFTREEMAAFLCVNRSALSHELSLMEQEGLISFRKNEFTLLQKDKWATHNTYEI